MGLPESKLNSSNLFPDIKIGEDFLLDIWESYRVSQDYLDNEEYYIDYTVSQYERWDQIAEKIYGERELWWVLLLTNSIEDPFLLYSDSILPESIGSIKILKAERVKELTKFIRQRRIALDIEFKNKLKKNVETN